MTEDEYNLKRERILARLDKIRPTSRTPISKRLERLIEDYARGTLALTITIAVFATFLVAFATPFHTWDIPALNIFLLSMLFFLVFWGFLIFGGIDDKIEKNLASRVAWSMLTVVGVSRWPQVSHTSSLNQHIVAEPRIKQTCIRLASQNESAVLTGNDTRRILNVIEALETLKKAFVAAGDDRAEIERTINYMNTHGVLDHARAARQAAQMDKSTAPAPEPAAPPARI